MSKVAIVTGGSRGIGAAVAERLAIDGFDVVFSYAENEAAAQAVTSKIESHGRRSVALKVDAGSPEGNERLVSQATQQFGRVDVLVCNAGVFPYGDFEAYDLETIERAFSVNVTGPIIAAQHAIRKMEGGGGRVIFIGSAFGERAPIPAISLYAATKAALVGLAKGMARDLGSKGILVNVVQPGPIDTDLNPAQGPFGDTLRGFLALPDYGAADDVAGLVSFLTSDSAGNITGSVFNTDGGITC